MIKLNLIRAWQQIRRVPATAREARVLFRAGLASASGPRETARALLDLRWGMTAGAIRIAARRDPHAVGLVDELGELTFGQLDLRSNALARAWRRRGLDETSVVAVLCRDHRGLVESVFAAGKLGGTVLLLNTGFAAPQLAAVAESEGVSALVYDAEFTSVLVDLRNEIPRYLAWVDGDDSGPETLSGLIVSTSDAALPRPRTLGRVVLLTSGTTGTPKGAVRQISSPFAAAQFLDRVPLGRKERTLVAAPLFHGTGLSQLLLAVALGSTTVTRRMYDPLSTLVLMQQYRCENLVLVPTMLQRLLQLGDDMIARYDADTLRVIVVAGSALPPELGNHAMDVFGAVVYNVYGSTEVAVASVATPEDWKLAPGTVGRVPVGCTVHIYGDTGTRIGQAGVTGRVYVGSGLRFAGYTDGSGMHEIDGLLASGDVGHFDENGLLFIDGRDDDMIVSGGENVFPAEVENLLVEHPAIAEAAVIGVDDADFGQRLKALIVLRAGEALSEDDVKQHVRSKLARHKVPRQVEFIAELPRNATGKVLRGELTSDQ